MDRPSTARASGSRIEVDRPLDTHLNALLQHIAYWVFEDQALQAGATHRQLVGHTSAYFRNEVVEDVHEARALAERFVGFCHGRGWVLVPSGSTEDGEELYEFAHRTFLEYFTAGFYAAAGTTSQQLADLLLPHVEVDEWEMVALLAVQIRNETVRGSGTELLVAVADRSERAAPQCRGYLLAFAARTYEFMVPRPTASRRLAALAVEHHVRTVAADEVLRTGSSSGDRLANDHEVSSGTLARLVGGDPDGRRPVLESFISTLIVLSTDEDERVRVVATDCAHNMHLCSFGASDGDWALRVREEVWSEVQGSAIADAERMLLVALVLHRSRKLEIAQVLEWHGCEWLFENVWHPAFPRVQSIAFAEWLLGVLLEPANDTHVWSSASLQETLCSVGDKLLTTPAPWVRLSGWRSPYWLNLDPPAREDASRVRAEQMPDEVLIVALVLALVSYKSVEPEARPAFAEFFGKRCDRLAKGIHSLVTQGEPPVLVASPEKSTFLRLVLEHADFVHEPAGHPKRRPL